MEVVKIIRGNGSIHEYEFPIPTTIDQIDAAMDGIGGRPRDREKLTDAE